MILASFRGPDFHGSREFGPTRFRTEANAADGPDMTFAEFFEATTGRRVAFLIHGYRSPGAVGDEHPTVEAYSQMAQECLRIGFDEVVGILWPSLDLRVEFLPAIPMAEQAGRRLAGMLNGVYWFNPAEAPSITLITHSLGARVGLAAAACYRVLKCVLTGPAIRQHDISDMPQADFLDAANAHGHPRIIVVKSANDPVLRDAFPLASGFVPALGCVGPVEPHPATVIDANQVHEHSGYRKSPEVWAAIKEALA